VTRPTAAALHRRRRPDQYRMPVKGLHPYTPGESGTQCVACWGWVDDTRHTTRLPTRPYPAGHRRQGTHR
jgi:hypothetical protein